MRDAETPGTWIFLRGLARESAHWDDFPARFAESIPNGGIWLADLPGNGRHWNLPSSRSIPAMLEPVRQEALAAAKTGPVYLLAISLGGMVALEWLRRHPQETAGAVLLNTSLRGLSPLRQRLCWRVWPALLAAALTQDSCARERAILGMTSHQAGREGLAQARAEAYRQHPISRANLLRQLIAAAAYRPPPQRPAAPLLLLNSLGDRLVAPACSEALARHWDAPLATHPWAGHDLPLDDPGWVIAEVSRWLANRWERPPTATGTADRHDA